MKHADINQTLIDSFLGESVRVHDYYGCLRICEVLHQAFYIQISISQANNFWRWKYNDIFRSPFSVGEVEIVNTFVEYLEHMYSIHKRNKNDEIVSKWSFIFREFKTIERKPTDWAQDLKPMCSECGLDLSKPMGYVCPSTRCPTGLSRTWCKK